MEPKARIPGAWYAWVIAGILWVWTFWACAGEWQNTDAYSYGFFVPLLAGYFFWRRWPELRPAPPAPREVFRAWVFLAVLVILAGPLELLRQTPLYWRPVLWAMGGLAVAASLAAAFLAGGRAGMRTLFFPVCFPLIGIPWPGQVELAATVSLQGWVATATGEILNWFGVAAAVEGKTIRVANCILGVEEACSGLQGLQSSMMVALAGGEVFRQGLGKRAVLLAWAVGVALVGNLLRAVILGFVAIRLGPEGVSTWHDFLGMAILLVVILVVWAVAHAPNPASETRPPAAAAGSAAGWERRIALGLLGLLLFYGGFVFWWYATPSDSPDEPVLTAAPGVSEEKVPEEVWRQLRPSEGAYLKNDNLLGYHFWWAPGKGKASQFYHRPEACMPGVGWQITGEVREFSIPLHGVVGQWTAFPFERAGQAATLWWAVWMDGRPVSKFSLDQVRAYYFDRAQSLNFIRERKSTFSYEVAACLIPGEMPDLAEVERRLGEMFHRRDGVRPTTR